MGKSLPSRHTLPDTDGRHYPGHADGRGLQPHLYRHLQHCHVDGAAADVAPLADDALLSLECHFRHDTYQPHCPLFHQGVPCAVHCLLHPDDVEIGASEVTGAGADAGLDGGGALTTMTTSAAPFYHQWRSQYWAYFPHDGGNVAGAVAAEFLGAVG